MLVINILSLFAFVQRAASWMVHLAHTWRSLKSGTGPIPAAWTRHGPAFSTAWVWDDLLCSALLCSTPSSLLSCPVTLLHSLPWRYHHLTGQLRREDRHMMTRDASAAASTNRSRIVVRPSHVSCHLQSKGWRPRQWPRRTMRTNRAARCPPCQQRQSPTRPSRRASACCCLSAHTRHIPYLVPHCFPCVH